MAALRKYKNPKIDGITIMKLGPRNCRAVVGPVSGAETRYCGKKTILISSWCAHHHLMYMTPAKGKIDVKQKAKADSWKIE